MAAGGGGTESQVLISSSRHRKQREADWKLANYIFSKPATSDVLPPAWAHCPQPPKTAPPTRNKLFKYLKPMRDIYSNHYKPQYNQKVLYSPNDLYTTDILYLFMQKDKV